MKPNTDWTGMRDVERGSRVRIREAGFGRAAIARVIDVSATGFCEVQLIRVGATGAGWKKDNRTTIHAAKLEVKP